MPTALTLDIHNRIGALAEVTKILAEAGVNVFGIQLGRGPDDRNLRLTVDRPEAATVALAKHGYAAHKSELVSLRVQNSPGAIAAATRRLAAKGINIEAMFLSASAGKHVEVVMQVDDPVAARKALGTEEE
jgi:hypothetical protein